MVPPPLASGALPATPARNRKPTSMLRLLLTAQAMVKITKKMLQILINELA